MPVKVNYITNQYVRKLELPVDFWSLRSNFQSELRLYS